MLVEALPLLRLVELWIMLEAIFDAAGEHRLGVEIAVGIRYNLTIDAAWRVRGGGAVILNGFLHDLKLLRREPFLEACVGGQNLSASDVVYGAGPAHTQIVVSGNDVSHVDVDAE